MAQSRNKTGVEFERQICEVKGWTRTATSPKISWTGVGHNNFEKIASINFDPTKFVPTSSSTYNKCDAITDKNEKVEIKKYKTSKLKNWVLYSEPIFKVASREALYTVTQLFGNGDMNKAIEVYNNFLDGIVKNIGQDILNNITQSNIGIQLIDGFVPQSNLEYRWVVKKGWADFNRLTIEFRIKSMI